MKRFVRGRVQIPEHPVAHALLLQNFQYVFGNALAVAEGAILAKSGQRSCTYGYSSIVRQFV
jgi:hypothetical protein